MKSFLEMTSDEIAAYRGSTWRTRVTAGAAFTSDIVESSFDNAVLRIESLRRDYPLLSSTGIVEHPPAKLMQCCGQPVDRLHARGCDGHTPNSLGYMNPINL